MKGISNRPTRWLESSPTRSHSVILFVFSADLFVLNGSTVLRCVRGAANFERNRESSQENCEEERGGKVQFSRLCLCKFSIFIVEDDIFDCRIRLKDKLDRATVEQVMDARTRMIIFKLLNRGVISEINGCISTGKEANVYHATGKDNMDLAIKVVVICALSNGELHVDKSHRILCHEILFSVPHASPAGQTSAEIQHLFEQVALGQITWCKDNFDTSKPTFPYLKFISLKNIR